MIQLSFIGEIDALAKGIEILSEDYGFSVCDAGIPVKVEKGEGLSVSFDGASAKIGYGRPCEFSARSVFFSKETQRAKSNSPFRKRRALIPAAQWWIFLTAL